MRYFDCTAVYLSMIKNTIIVCYCSWKRRLSSKFKGAMGSYDHNNIGNSWRTSQHINQLIFGVAYVIMDWLLSQKYFVFLSPVVQNFG